MGDIFIDLDVDIPVNLNEVPDGLYEVITCDQKYDWESGYLDSYNLWPREYREEVV